MQSWVFSVRTAEGYGVKSLESPVQKVCGLLYELLADLVGMAPTPVLLLRAPDPLIEGAEGGAAMDLEVDAPVLLAL
jgi:hypothetical protein